MDEEMSDKTPTPLEIIDFSAVIEMCKDHIANIENDEHDDDTDHYIYETAMEAVFGPKVWEWINKRL
jgi:hypothetical protein